MDFILFVSSGSFAVWWQKKQQEGITKRRLCRVNAKNEEENTSSLTNSKYNWLRATYILIMYEPPHLFYEPKEWSHTSVLLLKNKTQHSANDSYDNVDNNYTWKLPGSFVYSNESYQQSAVRQLKQNMNINVCVPENCLHHLFTFPYAYYSSNNQLPFCSVSDNSSGGGIWGDCYECVYRGKLDNLKLSSNGANTIEVVCMSLSELKDLLEEDEDAFQKDSCHALKLYFQRQGDLRAKRRLLKGYSSIDLDHYGLRTTDSNNKPLLLLDSFHDDARKEAMDFTMKTDDGMSTNLLYKADIIILGVSRTGKTPLSIYISQTTGLRVSNIPLVFELSPPKELTDINTTTYQPIIDPRRVFCLTRDVEEMEKLRLSRMKQALKSSQHKTESTYANFSYIRKDLAKARNFVKQYGFTEIDVTDRALEECANIIITKMKERFPDMHILH